LLLQINIRGEEMEKKVSVMYACMHEGDVSVETLEPVLKTSGFTEIDEEIVQYVVFQRKIKCHKCESKVWEK